MFVWAPLLGVSVRESKVMAYKCHAESVTCNQLYLVVWVFWGQVIRVLSLCHECFRFTIPVWFWEHCEWNKKSKFCTLILTNS